MAGGGHGKNGKEWGSALDGQEADSLGGKPSKRGDKLGGSGERQV